MDGISVLREIGSFPRNSVTFGKIPLCFLSFFLSTHADRLGVDISVTVSVCLFVCYGRRRQGDYILPPSFIF